LTISPQEYGYPAPELHEGWFVPDFNRQSGLGGGRMREQLISQPSARLLPGHE
jgi:hypothetical protein